jgi:hypothetical protein
MQQYRFRGPDGRVYAPPAPKPQPRQPPISLWEFIQGFAVVAGLAVSMREISRW